MSKFYTYCQTYGDNILLRGYENSQPVIEKVKFKPTLYITTNKKTEWRTLYENTPLEPKVFDSIKEAKDFKEQYKDIHGISVHGMEKFQYQYIHDNYTGDIQYDLALVRSLTFDIEVITEDGSFPSIQEANAPITLISMYNSRTKHTLVLGLKDYYKDVEDTFDYRKFDNEAMMLKYFIAYNEVNKFDVWTGWNTSMFDIPYITNRIVKLLGKEVAKKLSPFNIIREKFIEIFGKEVQTYDIYGIVDLDYLELYKKFSQNEREQYTLDAIAQEELGETKVAMLGTSFKDNYDNHFNTFVKYGAMDSMLVKKFEDKLKLVELAFGMAYLIKCNLVDIYKTVQPWEVYIYNALSKKGIAVPPRRAAPPAEFVGAWVKEPKPGLYGWTMSFDFSGLYNSIMRQWNMSPETILDAEYETSVQDWLFDTQKSKDASDTARAKNCTIAANGTMYTKEKIGILAECMRDIANGRSVARKRMNDLEKEFEKTGDVLLLPEISALNNKQTAYKLLGNAGYGAVGNKGFLYTDIRMAEAITTTGQLSNMHLTNSINKMMNKILKTDGVDYVVYGDTDSVYLNCQPLVDLYCKDKPREFIIDFLDKFGKTKCQGVIKESVDYVFDTMNGYDRVMGSKREVIASKALFRSKKNYALYIHNSEGVPFNPPKIKVLGIEVVRSSSPKWCRSRLKDGIKYIFEKDEMFMRSWFANAEKEFMTLPVEDIGSPKGISDIDKWIGSSKLYLSRCPIHVRGAILYNHYLQEYPQYPPLHNGDKLKTVYLKMPNVINENVMAFPSSGKLPVELKLHKYVDYPLQFEKVFRNPLESLTNLAGWSLEERSTLEGFM